MIPNISLWPPYEYVCIYTCIYTKAYNHMPLYTDRQHTDIEMEGGGKNFCFTGSQLLRESSYLKFLFQDMYYGTTQQFSSTGLFLCCRTVKSTQTYYLQILKLQRKMQSLGVQVNWLVPSVKLWSGALPITMITLFRCVSVLIIIY